MEDVIVNMDMFHVHPIKEPSEARSTPSSY